MDSQKLSDSDVAFAKGVIDKISAEFHKEVIGQQLLLERLLIALFTGGHLLLEGVPGLAKTRAVTVIANAVNATFKRVQFTPDLLPSDIIGVQIFNPKEATYFTKTGPIFANIVLADEINRAPAKVQSALLEAMQEKQVTIGGQTYKLPAPFFVLATQNPIEQEGTYPLPEAQVDRFLLKTIIDYPTLEEENQVLSLVEKEEDIQVQKVISLEEVNKIQMIARQVFLDEKIRDYIARLIHATRYPDKFGMPKLTKAISFGASPRASITFMRAAKVVALMNGRNYVIPEDIKIIRHDVLRHRVILTYEAEADGVLVEQIIDEIFANIKVP